MTKRYNLEEETKLWREEVEFWYVKATELLGLAHRVAMDYAISTMRHKRGMETIFVIRDGFPLVVDGKLVKDGE
jgi:hypothetical protein